MRVRIAKPADMDAVYRLTHDAYVGQGYCEPQPDGMLRHYPHLDGIPETTVFVAEKDGVIIGTNSLTLDGPRGLHVDDDFPYSVAEVRRFCQADGERLGASWRIVTCQKAHESMRVVVELVDITIKKSIAEHVDVLLFSFHPGRHERIWRRLLGLTTLCHADRCKAVSAPCVLMMGTVSGIAANWRAFRKTN